MKLHFYETTKLSDVMGYQLTEEQLRYTGTPLESIEKAQTDSDRHCILAIEDMKLVTFFVLHQNEGVLPYTDNPWAILVRAFSTDYRYQGKGYAKEALSLLPGFVEEQFPTINEIILAVNVTNIAAQRLYVKSGFVDEGVRTMGKKGELIVMSYHLTSDLKSPLPN
ncbi:GNAT family N-acetyltransferase [Ornithinibacillus contaminans]|uniref:GNAT family N-acetyltransferase n=1 Tax=Ornithinibacillus contaminans TaxID=694055 RepID=UPI00064D7ECC|nr:GNAT family protein [Ornithinibacillus contaminans]